MRRHWRRIPIAVRFFATHAAVGFGLGTLLTAAILWADPGGAGTIIRGAAGHPWPLLLLWFFLGLTLGAVQSAAAVMLMGYPEAPKPPPGGTRAPLTPVPVRIPARR
jgi:tetrahydromethanopterin S-methyltransferase subunit E